MTFWAWSGLQLPHSRRWVPVIVYSRQAVLLQREILENGDHEKRNRPRGEDTGLQPRASTRAPDQGGAPSWILSSNWVAQTEERKAFDIESCPNSRPTGLWANACFKPLYLGLLCHVAVGTNQLFSAVKWFFTGGPWGTVWVVVLNLFMLFVFLKNISTGESCCGQQKWFETDRTLKPAWKWDWWPTYHHACFTCAQREEVHGVTHPRARGQPFRASASPTPSPHNTDRWLLSERAAPTPLFEKECPRRKSRTSSPHRSWSLSSLKWRLAHRPASMLQAPCLPEVISWSTWQKKERKKRPRWLHTKLVTGPASLTSGCGRIQQDVVAFIASESRPSSTGEKST